MAHVSYTGITDNSARDATAVNSIFTAFQTQSTNVSESNWRDEGLDERVMAGNVATSGYDSVDDNDASTVINTAGAWATFTPGVAFNLTNGGVGWTVGQGFGHLRVRFATAWSYIYAVTPSPLLQFRFAYQIDGGAVTAVPNSDRILRGNQAVAYDVTGVANVTVLTYKDNFKYAFLIPFPLDGATHTVNQVRVQVNVNANYTFRGSVFTATRFNRSVS